MVTNRQQTASRKQVGDSCKFSQNKPLKNKTKHIFDVSKVSFSVKYLYYVLYVEVPCWGDFVTIIYCFVTCIFELPIVVSE